jgi:site-specific recombinase XerD
MAFNPNYTGKVAEYYDVIRTHTMNGTLTGGDLKLVPDPAHPHGRCTAETTEDNVLITRFIQHKIEKKHVSASRRRRLAYCLVLWRRYLAVPYAKATMDDLKAAIRTMENAVGGGPVASKQKRGYTANSLNGNMEVLVTFLHWLIRKKVLPMSHEDITEEFPVPEKTYTSIKPQDVLTEEQVNQMIAAASTARDKALIAVLYDSGIRSREAADLTWADVDITKDRAHLVITDAKDRTKFRNAYMFKYASYLRELRKIQEGDKDEDFVFRMFLASGMISKEPISRAALAKAIHNVAKQCDIKFPRGANARLFRTSNVTNRLKQGVNPIAIMKTTWSSGMNSKMYRHYEKLAGEDLEKMLVPAGEVEIQRPVMPENNKAIICACGTRCAPNARFCDYCGTPLTRASATETGAVRADIQAMLNDSKLHAILEESLTKYMQGKA